MQREDIETEVMWIQSKTQTPIFTLIPSKKFSLQAHFISQE